MNPRRRAATVALAALLGLVAAGCSGDDTGGQAEPAPSAPSTTGAASITSTTEAPPATGAPAPVIPIPADGEVFTDPDRDVRDMAVDSEGRIWSVGAGGAARFDPTTREVEVLTTADGLPATEINAMAVDGDGVVWLGTAGGLASVRGDEVLDHGAPPRSETVTNPEPRIYGTTVGPDGDVWAYHAPNLVRFDGRSWDVVARVGGLAGFDGLDIVVAPDGTAWVSGVAGTFGTRLVRVQASEVDDVSPPGFSPSTLDLGTDGSVWATSPLDGVARFSDGAWTTWEVGTDIPSRLAAGLAVDDDGTVWVLGADTAADGTGQAVATRFDGTAWELVHTVTPPGDITERDVSSGLIQTSWPAVATGDDLWAAAGNGIFGWVDGEFVPAQPTGSSLVGTRVASVDLADDGTVWVLTDRAINRYDGTEWTALPHGGGGNVITAVSGTEAWAVILRDEPYLSQLTHVVGDRVEFVEDPAADFETLMVDLLWIEDVAVGGDGTVWLATMNGPARLADGVPVYDDVPLVPPATQAVETAPDGTMWAASSGRILSLGPQGWVVQASDEGWSDVLHVAADAAWTGGGPIGRFDLASRTWSTWDSVPGYEGLGITAIAEGPDGVAWAGAVGFGGFSTDPTAYSSTGGVFTLRDDTWVGVDHPLLDPSSRVADVDVGGDGSLWVATDTGLVHLLTDEL